MYLVRLKRSAEKELDRVPADTHRRIVAALQSLSVDPRPHGCRKLTGAGDYRIRVGHYRILYSVDDAGRQLEVIAVGHRRDVYHTR